MIETDCDLSQVFISRDPPGADAPGYQIEYAQFVEDLIELTEAVELAGGNTDVFVEARAEPIRGGLRRTKELTGEAIKAYGATTSGIGDVMHGSAQLTLKLVALSAKVINFVCKMITVVPVTMTKMIGELGRVTSNSVMQFTGKMKIYLTADSLELFDSDIKQQIDRFITLCGIFSDGDKWSKSLRDGDFRQYNKMKQISLKLNSIRYEPTVVNIGTDQAKATYFTADSSYFVRLKSLNEFFKSKQGELETLRKALQLKIAEGENNGSIYKLKAAQRLKAQDSIQMVSSFMTIVGKYFQYVQQDLLTIESHVKQAQASANKQADKRAKASRKNEII